MSALFQREDDSWVDGFADSPVCSLCRRSRRASRAASSATRSASTSLLSLLWTCSRVVGATFWLITTTAGAEVTMTGAWTEASLWPAPDGRLAVFVTRDRAWNWSLVNQSYENTLTPMACNETDHKELEIRSVVWSPSSKAFAVEVFGDDVAFLYVCRLGERNMQTLDFGTITSQGARWSPDGAWLFFSPGVEDPEGSSGIYGFKLSTGQVFRLARDRTWVEFAVGTTHFLAVEVRQADLALVRVLRKPLEEAAVEVARWVEDRGKFVLKDKEP